MQFNERLGSVTAIVPTLGRNAARLEQCLGSLLDSTGVESFSIIVIQNDPAVNLKVDSKVTVISPGLNLGNLGALEYARSIIDTEFIWMIQDDMQVEKSCLLFLKARMAADSSLALISPITLREGLVPAFSRGGMFTDAQGTLANFPSKRCTPDELGDTSTLDFVAGSGGLIRTKALEMVGGFNLRLYPLMHGDVDLCMNLKRVGLKFDLEKDATISHESNGSTPGILSKILLRANDRIIRDKFLGIENEFPVLGDVDPRIIYAVAQKSSLLFIDVANAAQSDLSRYEYLVFRKQIRFAKRVIKRLMQKFL